MNLSVVIPSKTTTNFLACASAVRKLEPDAQIILVDDGVDLGQAFSAISLPFHYVTGMKPFIFARNVNMGILAAGDEDVVVLNDDALLETPGGFSALQQLAERYTEFGIIAAACNNVGNVNQWRKTANTLREEPRMVCFTSVLIPRRTIETVGLLDERYEFYGLDDDDYCLRVRNAGLKIGIYDGCVVEHSKLPSTYRTSGAGDFRANLEIFKKKWGHDNFGRPCPVNS